MNRSIDLVPATAAHVVEIVPRLRPSDLAELEAEGHPPFSGIDGARRASLQPMSALVAGQVEAMFGIMPQGGAIGSPWFVGTCVVQQFPRAMVQLAHLALMEMGAQFAELRNTVDQRNTTAIYWLERLGFTMGAVVPHGPDGLPHVLYSMRLRA